MRWRITVASDDHCMLRGYLDGDYDRLTEFSAAMEPFGLVIASPATDDYNPFEVK